jgi:hypothetical protein
LCWRIIGVEQQIIYPTARLNKKWHPYRKSGAIPTVLG